MSTILNAELKRSASPQLTALLYSPDQGIVARAALAFGRIGDPAGRPALRPLLRSSNARVRAMAAYGLGLLADEASLEALSELARHDPAGAVRYGAVDALGRILTVERQRVSRSLASAMLAVVNDPNPAVRGHAAANTDVFRSSAYALSIADGLGERFVHEADGDVRWHLMWALFRAFPLQAGRAVLVAGLHDPDELVRVEAVRAWAKRADPDAAALVRPLLADPSWRVQLQAAETLRQLAKEPPTEHLTALPPGLHLPPVAPRTYPTPGAPTLPPPAAPPSRPSAPALADLTEAPLYAPASALGMNEAAPGLHPRVRIVTTKGALIVRLYPEWAPITVANFLHLAASNYYDYNRWFRIVPDFVVQSGDPNDNGEGDAGYTIPAELNPVEQRSGVIAMGLNYENNHALRDSAGTQFYITLSPQLHLDRDFTVFGEVSEGFDVLARLVESDRIFVIRKIADG
ncbi:MAG TPA: peptidylprolyl isomerase [Candidatus Baltobacteraceae bacterium]|nr:peptidylprolyl isomerase [Candidatus Baltobacteraceae bacterium]